MSFGLHLISCGLLLLILLLANSSQLHVGAVATCPGLVSAGVAGKPQCTAACQAATCNALATFFHTTYDPSATLFKSWRQQFGWEGLLSKNCSQILAAGPNPVDGTPAYCSWYGVTCCSLPGVLMKYCNVSNSLMQLRIGVNGLNGRVDDPNFMQSIVQLHSCGLVSLVVPGNALSGSMTDAWGDLVNLQAMDICKYQQQQLSDYS
jgi:hypothetical protein